MRLGVGRRRVEAVATKEELQHLSLMDLVPALRPEWDSPTHLAVWCGMLEGALKGKVRYACSIPYQHWKTTTTLVGVVWLLLKRPELRIILLTHSHAKAMAISGQLRELWQLAGGDTKAGSDRIDDWQTPEGGGCVTMSAEQSKLGYPCDVLLVDDPLNEKNYWRPEEREKVYETIFFYSQRMATHLDSCLIVMSRWHPQDPIGISMDSKEENWEVFCASGIENYGTVNERAFAPDVLSLDEHHKLLKRWAERDPSLRTWHAQVQNDPMPDAHGFFPRYTPFNGAPPLDGSIIIGVDLAFSAGVKVDYAAFVVMTMIGDTYIVIESVRHQRGLFAAVGTLRMLHEKYPTARFASYVAGPERGIYNAVTQSTGIVVEQMPARWHKGYRAQNCATYWQRKRVLVLTGQDWTGPLIAECNAFDGGDGGIDDQVDAMVAAFDMLEMCKPAAGFGSQFTFGSPGAAG